MYNSKKNKGLHHDYTTFRINPWFKQQDLTEEALI